MFNLIMIETAQREREREIREEVRRRQLLAGRGTDTVAARVDGPGRPATALSASGETLHWSCTCPAGRGGAFCAHLVATAQVAWDRAPSRE